MITKKQCAGCDDDFYNGQNPYGIAECWSFKKATEGKYLLIHVDQPPPYDATRLVTLPTCYRKPRFVKVKPEALDSKGYWRS